MKFEKKTRYRIYTEDVDSLAVSKIQIIVNWHFPSFTIIHSDGVYKRKKERGLIIEIITEADHKSIKKIRKICDEINRIHKQECCLVTKEVIESVVV
jgi:hypothetical protein